MHIIIAAGGISTRLASGQKKQFLQLKGKTLLEHCLQCFTANKEVKKTVVALPGDELKHFSNSDVLFYVAGGPTRVESVHNAFSALGKLPENEIILIHDAARPLVSQDLIDRVAAATRAFGAAIPVVPVKDTVKTVDAEGLVRGTVPRELLRAAQTPQGFLYKHLELVYDTVQFSDPRFTDEAMLVEAVDVPIKTIPGDERNIKITTEIDLRLAEVLVDPPC